MIFRRLKYVATVNDETLSEVTDPDFELQYVDIGNVDSIGKILETVSLRFANAPSRARRLVQDGDVIVSTVRTYLKAIAPIENPTDNLVVSTGFAVVRPKVSVLDKHFCKYMMRSAEFLWEVERRSSGVSYPAINASDLVNISIPLPPKVAQTRVAQFLTRETKRIDLLIAEKEQFLGLLKTRIQLIVGQSVTKGLDRSQVCKESHCAWVDEIPVTWEEMQLKRTWLSADYGLSESIREKGSIAVLRMSCIVDGRIDATKAGTIDEIDDYLLLRKNDILFNRTNSLDQIAKVGILDIEPETPLTFASYLVRLRTNERVVPQFLVYLLNSQQFLEYARGLAIPAIGQANLSPSRYGEIKVPIPPIEEQARIVAFLDGFLGKTKPLLEEIELSISLLKERRSALITAAVTGQIPLEEITG